MNIYGKENAVNIVSSMIKKERLAHSFLIYGEKGTGKKFLANYIAMMMMCKNSSDGVPCGKCRICRNIQNNIHADVVPVQHSGKLGGFSTETVRNICSEAYVFPNEGDKKIYIFSDADSISVSAQNILLKTIEEPPDFAYFIFTASSKNVFLDTVISRVISLGIKQCSNDECLMALKEHGVDKNDAENAMSMLGGNIGNCLSYIKDEKFREIVELTKKLAECIINKDEYGFLKTVSPAENDRNMLRQIIYMLDGIIRDSVVMKFDESLSSGCYRNGAEQISEKTALLKGIRIHYLLSDAVQYLDSNVSMKIITASLCRSISDC